MPAEDVRASPPKGGANPAFAPCCPRCKDNPGVTPCFRLFISLHPNTGAMMPSGPEWRILSYHVPGVCAFMPEVDDENEAYRLQHDAARTMAAAKEIRHWNPEAPIGDDEYIVANVKPAVVEAAMYKTPQQERERVERIKREGTFSSISGPGASQRDHDGVPTGQEVSERPQPRPRGGNRGLALTSLDALARLHSRLHDSGPARRGVAPAAAWTVADALSVAGVAAGAED
eukprot:jgi/Tetstr1/441626/TSEL_029853.t1